MSKSDELPKLETWNQFVVGAMASGETIVVVNLPAVAKGMTKAEALNLAAYLVALADDHNQFPELLAQVCK